MLTSARRLQETRSSTQGSSPTPRTRRARAAVRGAARSGRAHVDESPCSASVTVERDERSNAARARASQPPGRERASERVEASEPSASGASAGALLSCDRLCPGYRAQCLWLPCERAGARRTERIVSLVLLLINPWPRPALLRECLPQPSLTRPRSAPSRCVSRYLSCRRRPHAAR